MSRVETVANHALLGQLVVINDNNICLRNEGSITKLRNTICAMRQISSLDVGFDERICEAFRCRRRDDILHI